MSVITSYSIHYTKLYDNLDIPTKVDDVPPEILDPKNTWTDKDAYEKSAKGS